jgi:uncharacterized protein YlxW (UPF0749 family)
VIQVNQVPIASPYKIEAIGDPDVLYSGLNLPGGILDYFKRVGFQVSVKKAEQIVLPPYTGMTGLRFAQPTGGS